MAELFDKDRRTLTLLIAESNPKEKEVIIDLVMNFLNEEQYQDLIKNRFEKFI